MDPIDAPEFTDLPVIDCHVHTWMLREALNEETLRKQEEALVEILQESSLHQIYAFDSGTHAPLYFKARHPGLFYAGGFAPWSGRTHQLPEPDWENYVSGLIRLGYDGIGETGNKPATRETHTPLDSPYYAGLWAACEEHRFPVLCHTGDVEDFWHENLTPNWAKARGWGYYRGDYPAFEELYAEVENVLSRHPELPITLCHFLFLSPHLERAEGFLEAHPNAHLDLSLGVELMYNISRRRDEFRDFFIRHGDRILFGTDIGMSTNLPQHLARVSLIRRFLETGEEFHTPEAADDLLTRYPEPYIGLDLPRGTLEMIYAGNFRRLWGSKPRRIDLEAAISTCEKEGNAVLGEALKGLNQ
jgi:predicted TIM-barrel fold metal-dependent hydrolase